MKTRGIIVSALVLLLTGISLADEGMWLYEAFPVAKVKAKYGWAPDQAWLDHVRLSSVRFNNGGSGSFVSADGLTFTNHHVGATCLSQISTPQKDFYKIAFYAKTRAEEVQCKDLELNVLESIEDVTAQVQGAVKPGMDTAAAGTAMRAEMSAIENDCATKTKLRCDVVTLYSGGMYHLYRYKKYTDVRLVFAPEFAIAFFGGDPDNFEYPRYDLDITFFRVYENGQPVHLANYLKWSKAGVGDKELVLVSGHPGSTGRLLTMSQLAFRRDVQYPWALKSYPRRIQAYRDFSAQSAENARIAQEDIFGYENSVKAYKGYQGGLLDKQLMADKQQQEDRMKQAVASDPAKKQQYGDPWSEIDQAMQTYRRIFLPLTYFERRAGLRGDLAGIARDLVRLAAEKPKPNGERLREYRESNLPSLEQGLFSTAPIYKSLEIDTLTESMSEMVDELGAENATVKLILAGKTPAERAKELVDGTRLDDVAVRKQLYAGGQAAIDASTDPLLQVMRTIDPEARQYRKSYDDQVDAVERRDGGTLAKIRFATEGQNMPPDATFTLRLSYGITEGFTEDGRGIVPAGTKVPYFTTMGGAFDHAAKHGNTGDYKLPESWMAAKTKIKLNTPFNTSSTPDIIGGNSGSPVVNKSAEVVGIIFDGNIQSLPWNFQYEDRIGRSVEVDSRGIIESLRSIYGATGLADELQGVAAKGAAATKK